MNSTDSIQVKSSLCPGGYFTPIGADCQLIAHIYKSLTDEVTLSTIRDLMLAGF